jgi:hypothetical protein
MKAEHTMTPAEEAEWVRMMQEGRLPPGPWGSLAYRAKMRVSSKASRQRELAVSHEGKAARLAGLIAFLEWFGL